MEFEFSITNGELSFTAEFPDYHDALGFCSEVTTLYSERLRSVLKGKFAQPQKPDEVRPEETLPAQETHEAKPAAEFVPHDAEEITDFKNETIVEAPLTDQVAVVAKRKRAPMKPETKEKISNARLHKFRGGSAKISAPAIVQETDKVIEPGPMANTASSQRVFTSIV